MTRPGPSGSGLARRPLLWGGIFSGLGSASAILVSGRLFSVFTPQSLLRATPTSSFVLAALTGATVWVLAATLLRLPVSTTHAILGAIAVQAAYLFGVSNLEWNFLFWRVLLPLVAGPFAALFGAYLLDRLTHRQQAPQSGSPGRIGKTHWGSAAATAYARGINDAPKMAALGAFFLLGRPQVATWLPYLVVAVAVVVGSMVLGHRVAGTLLGRAEPLEHAQRFKAGVATAALVSAGAYFGAPLSTTHVSEGARAGVGGGGKFLRSALRSIILAWALTLPASGLLAIAASIYGPKLWSLLP